MESAQYFCLHACYLTIMRTRTPGSRKTFSSKINILWVTVSQWFDCVSEVVCQNTFLSPRPNLLAPESPKIRHRWLFIGYWKHCVLAFISLDPTRKNLTSPKWPRPRWSWRRNQEKVQEDPQPPRRERSYKILPIFFLHNALSIPGVEYLLSLFGCSPSPGGEGHWEVRCLKTSWSLFCE